MSKCIIYKLEYHYQVANLFCYFPKEPQPDTMGAKTSTLGVYHSTIH